MEKQHKRPQDWSPAQRLRAVNEAATLSDEELGEFLRREGLHAHTLKQWRQDALAGLGASPRPGQKRISRRERQLERELRRKDKALAEAAALLVLQRKPRALRGGRGRLVGREVRMQVLQLIDEARAAGARLRPCCEVLGLDPRTVQRWRKQPEDRRPTAQRPEPANRLSEEDRERVRQIACSPRFRDLSPKQIVAQLADDNRYVASEPTFYRVLRASKLQRHREKAKPATRNKPREKVASGPNQVWSWDITYLRGPRRREYFYLYVALDVWSRKIVAWTVRESENGTHAARMIHEAAIREGCPKSLVLHSDRGSPMVSATLLGMLDFLSIKPSYSRPRVSNDNPYSESLSRTAKYRPEYPTKPFQTIEEATAWAEQFVAWYNHEHRHSKIGFVTPDQRHRGEDIAILERRRALYKAARARHPERWTRHTRRWDRPALVALNPSDETRVRLALSCPGVHS